MPFNVVAPPGFTTMSGLLRACADAACEQAFTLAGWSPEQEAAVLAAVTPRA